VTEVGSTRSLILNQDMTRLETHPIQVSIVRSPSLVHGELRSVLFETIISRSPSLIERSIKLAPA